MRELKIFCIMLIILFFIISAEFYLFSLIILFISGIFFFYKYIKLNKTVDNYNEITKAALHNQREIFINSLSHDLRIPLIAQLRALELIRNECFGKINNTQKEMLCQTEQSCHCILNLISLLINTYNIENSTYKLIYNKFNLYEIILTCFNELVPTASEKNITFEYNGEDKNLYLAADKDDIKKVIKNLLLSSIEYANSGDIISVKIKNINKKLQLALKVKEANNGCSRIEEHDSRFNAIGHSIRYHFCKKIIELHKGQILQNSNFDKSFVFELPLSA